MAPKLRDLTSGARAMLGILTSRWTFSGPRSVALSISDVCNTDCLMCWCHSPLVHPPTSSPAAARARKPRGPLFMEWDCFESVIRQLRAMGTFRVVLGGNGEPSMHPEFERMLELITSLGMEAYVLTNGLEISEERARVWAKQSAHFRFSLQGGDEESWLRVHPRGTSRQYEGAMRLIRFLAASRGPRVSTMQVIQRGNFRAVPAMVEQACQLGVGEVLFRPARATGPLASVVLDEAEEEELRRLLTDALQFARRYGIHTNIPEYLENSLYIVNGVMRTAHIYRTVPCYMGWIYSEIEMDGTVRPCLNSRIKMGRIGEASYREMWHSERYRQYRRDGVTMPRRGKLVAGCECHACCMVKYNINIHHLLRLKSFRYSQA